MNPQQPVQNQIQQFVIINNQMVPVYTVNPPLNLNQQMIPIQNVVYQPPPPPPPPQQDAKQPFNVVYSPVQGTPIVPQNQNPPVAEVPISALDDYTHNVICYVVTYLILFSGCIGVQFGLYGSQKAAALWITSYFLLVVVLVWFYVVKHKTFMWLLLLQTILLVLSLIFELAAFAMAIKHPVLYNYQTDVNSSEAVYNNRLLQNIYTYEECWQYYQYLSYSSYQQYYSYYCDSILGFTANDAYEYEFCLSLYDYSYQEYQLYYKSYCDPILGFKSGSGYYYSDFEFCNEAYSYYDYDTYEELYGFYCDSILGDSVYYEDYYSQQSSDNQCIQDGFYNPYKEYCYPLQYGMMAYAIVNVVTYLVLFGALSKRIFRYFQIFRSPTKTDTEPPQTQEQPKPTNQEVQV